MAIGDKTDGPICITYELLASVTAANSPPTLATDGLELNAIRDAVNSIPEVCSVAIVSTAGSGTMSCSARLWGYLPAASSWIPAGVGTAAAKGMLNDGDSIGEVSADKIAHSEPVDLIAHFSRLYLEITAIAGTATAVTGYVTVAGVS